MPTEEEFRRAAANLREIAERYGKFKESPEDFLEYVQELDQSHLRAFRDQSSQSSTTVNQGTRQIRPVVFLRHVVVGRILDGENITDEKIDTVKDQIDERETGYFEEYPSLHDAIVNQKERKRSAFHSWNLFTLLHGIDYGPRADDCKERLTTMADFLQERLALTDCDYHTAGFAYNQNFGTDHCWVALYPEKARNHQEAHQIVFSVLPDRYAFGMLSGDRVEKERYDDRREVTAVQIDVDELLETYRELLPRFYSLNRKLREEETMQANRVREEHPLNLILYGPPGTGKTYSVQRRALEIIEGTELDLSEEELSERFRERLEEGQIEFITFHPSYAYEEFVEGLRYDQDKGIPVVKDGILKLLAESAINPRPHPHRNENAQIWKISLGRQSNSHIFERCMEESEIAIGYVDDHDFIDCPDRDSVEDVFIERGKGDKSGSIDCVHQFRNKIKDGDYVAVYNDPKSIRAIGVVTGPYEYREDYDGYPHVRPVEWLDRSVHQLYEMNNSTQLTLKTLYPLHRVSLEEFLDLLPRHSSEEPDPHVLIIDEINRGNLSRVFGELVTLLEPDKRKGAPNEMSARLPYSQNPFTLPSNLYVIGTMNTADRSIALLDAAFRRRFEFEEMMPSSYS